MATVQATTNHGLGSNLKDELDLANPNRLSDALRVAKLGTALRSHVTRLFRKDPTAAAGVQLATLEQIVLPDDAKASTISRASVRAGGVTGELAVVLYGVTPGTGQIAVAPNGDLVTLAADAITDVDVEYTPARVDVVELDLPCPLGVCTIPTSLTGAGRGVCTLLAAEVLTGTITGKKIVLVPGAAPATLKANLSVDKTQVLFNVATDVPLTCRVKLGIVPAADLNTDLAADPFSRELFSTDGILK
jgi:hypothetical protein